jgi:hypothetical protein
MGFAALPLNLSYELNPSATGGEDFKSYNGLTTN